MFTELLDNLQREAVKVLSHVQIRQEDAADVIERKRREEAAKEEWLISIRKSQRCLALPLLRNKISRLMTLGNQRAISLYA